MVIDTPRRILIVKLSAIGDCLMATPVASALREAFPDAYIAWVVEKKSADVIQGNPNLDEVIVWDRNKGNGIQYAIKFIKSFLRLRKELRSKEFDVCVDVQGLLRSGLVSYASGAKVRVGFADAGEMAWIFYTHKHNSNDAELNAQQRNLDVLKVLGIESANTDMYMPITEEDRKYSDEFFEKYGLIDCKVVALIPATTWENKHWTPHGWAKVADILVDKYNARPVIMGSKADIPLAENISQLAKCKPIISAGKTTLKQAGAIIEKCNAVIGVDTGLLHMSVALNRPSVGLFGASAWRCFIKKDNFVWVAKDYPCSPCRRHPTCSNIDCMQAITPEDVEQAVRPWLQ